MDTSPPRGGLVTATATATVTASARPRLSHIPALDGLRGLAVVAVLMFHGGYLRGGFLGVDLFFVLSGFLVTSLLLVEWKGAEAIALGRFWSRRARRLLPALLGVVLVVALTMRSLAAETQWRSIRADGWATLLYVANWRAIFSGASYGAGGGRSPLEHCWSLAIEEQFYVIWPLLLVLVLGRGRGVRGVLRLSMVVATLGTLLLIGLSLAGASQNSLYLGSHTRMASVGMGAVLAAWTQLGDEAPAKRGLTPLLGTLGWIGAGVLAVAWVTVGLHDQALYRGILTLAGLAAVAVLASVTHGASPVMSNGLSVAPLRWLGLISYGLYLWHWPIFLWLDEPRTGLSGPGLFFVRILASLAAAIVSYELLEKPIRHGALPAPRSTWAAIGAFAGVVFIVSSTAIGAPESGLGTNTTAQGAVLTKANGDAPVLATYGDSVSELITSEGMVPLADELGVTIIDNGRWACEPLGDLPARDGFGPTTHWVSCLDDIRASIAELPADPDAVMVQFGGSQFDVKIDGTWRSPCDPEYQAAYTEAYQEIIDTLKQIDAPIVVVGQVPMPSTAVTRQQGLTDANERVACLKPVIRDLAEEAGVGYIDLAAFTCTDPEVCSDIGDDGKLRPDGIHYREEGSRAVARWLVPEVFRQAKGG